MKQNSHPIQRNESDLIAQFGAARLVKHLNVRVELIGGDDRDRDEAGEWCSLFLDAAVDWGVAGKPQNRIGGAVGGGVNMLLPLLGMCGMQSATHKTNPAGFDRTDNFEKSNAQGFADVLDWFCSVLKYACAIARFFCCILQRLRALSRTYMDANNYHR